MIEKLLITRVQKFSEVVRLRTPEFAIDFNYFMDYKRFEESVLTAENLGYHSVWYMDHLIWKGERLPWNEVGAALECWTVLSAIASATKRIRLGPLVSCNSYRNPALIAKMGATLDVISNGRLEFGIGSGWKEDEYLAYGYPFPSPSTRIGQLKEAVQIIKKMWTEEKPSFQGKYYQINGAICEPKPVQKPYPPIWIGGGGEKLTLKVVAELANGYNWRATPENYKRKLEVLREHCKQIGRDFDSIKKSIWIPVIIDEDEKALEKKVQTLSAKVEAIMSNPKEASDHISLSKEEWLSRRIVGTPEKCVKRIHEYIDAGVELFLLSFAGFEKDMKLFAETVISEFR